MIRKALLTAALALATFASTAHANQQVLLGNSFASGDEATAEVNLKIANANAAGCKAISVGGYGLGGGETGKEIGIPVLMECPTGVDLLPNGQSATPRARQDHQRPPPTTRWTSPADRPDAPSATRSASNRSSSRTAAACVRSSTPVPTASA